ncbi:hypothetical protein [Winogradskyella endarachnes]|uniref:STAS domain-containing protein n=1 Tax=Winogradskyella endarachnes TaxID=2681965 RepID=A0A6L6U997_9FLAO|nr:hypothetical protein [Winogradskyella endarachnes]MUU77482.1 hypothetical protein [Winogradskyella endarachnes]
MKNVIEFDGIKFWVDQNTIHCDLNTVFFKTFDSAIIEELFCDILPLISNGTYMPIIVNLESLNRKNALRIFRIISKSAVIKKLVLSRIFLVDSLKLKLVLSLNNILVKQVVPNKIYTDFNTAHEFCKNDFKIFNTVSQQAFS